MKLYISPPPSTCAEDGRGGGGISRVVSAQGRWLPEYGIKIVDDEKDAELVVIHAGALIDTDKPIVTCNHGLYWTGDFEWYRDFWQYNASAIEALRRASTVIVPSKWIAYPIRRDMRKVPVVIPHGIEIDEFAPQKGHEGYVLWGKPRVDVVSDARIVGKLAQRVPEIDFWTTFGRPTENVTVTGAMPYEDFQKILDGAMVWLATARETGDIGSREAMARGIPVLGWNHGATAELIKHKETGYLAEIDNIEDLIEGLHYCIKHRDRLGEAAREDVGANYQWGDLMMKYAITLKDALTNEQYPVQVSVVVPTYNYAHFLPEALDSIKEQTFTDVEVIVVDDCSTDDTMAVLEAYPECTIIRHESNQGLCAALNSGHQVARGKYITNLDADNLYPVEALEILHTALESKPWIDVMGGYIAMYNEELGHPRATDWPFGKIDPLAQLNHINQQPSSSMMRSRSIKRLGGYRLRQRKNEDGEFWCRAISAGLRFEQLSDDAGNPVEDPIMIYRWHGGNKSKYEGGEDDINGPLSWNYYYPWKNRHGIMPFASTIPSPLGSWAVRSYGNPHIAVVIPVGPGHERYLVDALDSVAGQTYQNIECVVANDTGGVLDTVAMGHPWVKVVDTGGHCGPAIARNTAIAAARAPLIAPLDADDLYYPDWLATAYQAWLQYPEDLVYGDCDIEDGIGDDGKVHEHPYDSNPWSYTNIKQHAKYQTPILFAKQWWEAVGGYPTDAPDNLWEDWLFGVLLHIGGVGATYVRAKWGRYRHWTAGEYGSKASIDVAGHGSEDPEEREEFKRKVFAVREWIERKEHDMPCRGCRGKRNTRTINPGSGQPVQPLDGQMVIVYEGERAGAFGINSRVFPGRKVRAERGKPIEINRGDAWMASLPGFREITEEEAAIPEFPRKPPAPPEIRFDKPQSRPVTGKPGVQGLIEPDSSKWERVAQELEEAGRKEEAKEKANGLAQLAGIRGLRIRELRRNGFTDMDKIREDFEQYDGENIRNVKSVGRVTLEKIRGRAYPNA